MIEKAQECAGDLDGFLNKLCGWVGRHNVNVSGESIQVVYDECFCELDAEVTQRMAATYCLCSRGWLMEMFEAVLGRRVEVEQTSSIKRGSGKCRFEICV